MNKQRPRPAMLVALFAIALHPGGLAAQIETSALEQAVVGGEVASPEDFQQVLVVCNGAPIAARAGLRLAPGCIVESGQTRVVATINRNEVEVVAEPGTQFDFVPDGIRVVVGQIFVKVRSLDIRSWFEVETLHGTARVRSTQFDVQVTRGRAVFRLLEGGLQVSAFDSPQQATIVPGQRAEIQGRRFVRTARMSRAEIRSIVRRVRATEQVLERAASPGGSYVGLLVPDLDAPARPVIESFTADGNLLVWRTRDASRVEIPGIGRVPDNGSQLVRPTTRTTYTLIATGEDGSTVQRRVTVGVARVPVIEELRWTGRVLQWSVRDAVRVSISGLGAVQTSGARAVGPGSYTLIAYGEGGERRSRNVVVPEPVRAQPAPVPRPDDGPSGGIIRRLPGR